MDFLTLVALLPALTTLLFTRRRKDGRRLFAAAVVGALIAGWVTFRWAAASGSEDTGTVLFFGYLVFLGPISGLLGAWLGLASAIALTRPRRSGAVLGAVAGIAATPLALLAWSAIYFEPEIRPEILPWMMGGSAAFWAACGAILGGLLDRISAPRTSRGIGATALGLVVVTGSARIHVIRDHMSPVSVLAARRDVAALRAKADRVDEADDWSRWARLDGYNEAARPAAAYAASDTLAALRHRAPEVRFAAARIFAALNDRRAVPVLREMVSEPYYDREAAGTLGRWRDTDSIPALEKGRHVDALVAIGGRDAEAALIRLSACADADTRRRAAHTLLRFHDARSQAAVRQYAITQIHALRGTPSESTAEAARSLRELRLPGWQRAVREYHIRLLRGASNGDRSLWGRSANALELEGTPESRRLRHEIAHTYR